MVSVSQQVGGSIGTALLSTIAVTAALTRFPSRASQTPRPGLAAQAAVHGYTTAFTWSATIFAIAAVVALVLYASKEDEPAPLSEPVMVG